MNKYFCTGEHAKEEPCAGKCPCADFWARIVFRVSANGEQGMDLDDVSFSVS